MNKIVKKKLGKMSTNELRLVCKKMKISCPGNKKNIIKKLLQPLDIKYNMDSRFDQLPDEVRDLISQYYPNFQSAQSLNRLIDLPEVLQELVLRDYSGLRNTSATKIQKAFKRAYIKRLIDRKPPNGINSIAYIISSHDIYNINFDNLVNNFKYNPLYYVNFNNFYDTLLAHEHMRAFVAEVVEIMARKHLVFVNINFFRINLSGLNLRDAIFNGMELIGTNFTNSNLRNAYFNDTIVFDEDPYGTLFANEPKYIILRNTNFTNADLRGTNFNPALLGRYNDAPNFIEGFNTCNFTGAKYNRETSFPYGFNLEGKGMVYIQ